MLAFCLPLFLSIFLFCSIAAKGLLVAGNPLPLSVDFDSDEFRCVLLQDCSSKQSNDAQTGMANTEITQTGSAEQPRAFDSIASKTLSPVSDLVRLPIYQPNDDLRLDNSLYFSRSFFRWLAKKRTRGHLKSSWLNRVAQWQQTTNGQEKVQNDKQSKVNKVNSTGPRRNRDFQTQGW